MKHIYRVSAAALALLPLSTLEGFSFAQTNWIGLAAFVFLLALFIFYCDRIVPIFRSPGTLWRFCWGILCGLLAGYLLHQFFLSWDIEGKVFALLSYLFPLLLFAYSAITMPQFLAPFGALSQEEELGTDFHSRKHNRQREKLLDTSVIIDGRIMDIAETKFMEGPFVVPNYVLREIQLISDSSDSLKRERGRRGLDMLNKLQDRDDIEVRISYKDYTDIREVDAKLIRMARESNAFLVTNDFNLNKVAKLQNVEVLNLNHLATALKPIVIPGEQIPIEILREGKDENQGIGYMEDGTMVVVENGGPYLGKKVKVSVTSVIQTAAGKMIFTQAQHTIDRDNQHGDSLGENGVQIVRRGGSRSGRSSRSRSRR